MNGKEYNSNKQSFEDQLFFSKDKEKKVKKHLHIRYIIILFLSNSFLLLLQSPAKPIQQIQVQEKALRTNYQLLSIPLKLFVPLNSDKQTISSLYDKSHNQIIHKIYIHQKSKRHSNLGDERIYYDVEIKRSDLDKIIKYKDSILHALPLTPLKHTKRKKNYEVIF